MEKEKTTSINKQVHDHNTTGMHWWASATGFVLAQGTHQAEEQRENQFKQCSDGEQTCKTTSCIGITPSECLLIDVVFSFSIDSLWFPARRCDISGTLVVPLVVFVVLDSLLGVSIALFFWQGALAWRDAYAWCRFASLFSIAHCLNWFSRCSSAWWVPWARTKPVADAHQCIPVVLWSWTCLLIDVVFSFSIDSLWFPARRCDISGTLVVPLVVFVDIKTVIHLKSCQGIRSLHVKVLHQPK